MSNYCLLEYILKTDITTHYAELPFWKFDKLSAVRVNLVKGEWFDLYVAWKARVK